MKKIVLCLLISALSLTPAAAFANTETGGEIGEVQEDTVKSVSMTADEAIAYADEHAPAVIAQENTVKYNEEMLALAKSNYHTYSTKTAYSDEMYLMKSGYRLKEAQMNLENARRAADSEKYSLRSNVYSSFYTYLSYNEKIKIYEDALKNAETRLQQAQAKYEKGTISALNVDSFRLAVLTAENNLNKAKRDRDAQLLYLKTTIGYPLGDNLVLVGSTAITEKQEEILPLEQAVKLTKENNNNVKSINNSIELLDDMMETYSLWYTANTYTYRVQKASYDMQRSAYVNSLSALEYNVTSLYNALNDIYGSLKALNMNLEIAEKTLSVVSAQFEMGLCTSDDVIEAEQNITMLKNNIVDTNVSLLSTARSYRSMYDSTN